MAREIWLGPILNANRERLLARCRHMLAEGRGREFIYLAATKPMMDAIVGNLLTQGVSGTIDELNVFLLSGFSRRIVSRAIFSDSGSRLPFFSAIDSETRPIQRPLFGRIIANLAASDELRSFSTLARTEGLVSSMIGLVAEIQRAGSDATEFRSIVKRRRALEEESKPTPDPIVTDTESLAAEGEEGDRARESLRIASIDYDSDTALVYEKYEAILNRHNLTDASRDYLRALAILRGEFADRPVRVPFVDEAKLLIIDGFFDILPVHGEILSLLVRRFPETIVNLNFDRTNPDAFSAFADVVERFGERTGFSEKYSTEVEDVAPGLRPLRAFLFNTRVQPTPPVSDPETDTFEIDARVVFLEAPDRVREVRCIAKRIKEMILEEGYRPTEIGIVYRNRDRYERLIRDVFRDESVAVSLGEKRLLTDLPSARAAMKVLEAACSNRTRSGKQIRISRILAILKSDYFSLAGEHSAEPRQGLLPFDAEAFDPVGADLTPDEVENAVAFVGAELNLDDWLSRASRIAARLSVDGTIRRVFDLDEYADENTETEPDSGEPVRSPRAKPDFPLDTLRKAIGLLDAVGQIVTSIPFEGAVGEMADAFRRALGLLSFERRLVDQARSASDNEDALRRAALDLRGLEGLNRAIDAVIAASTLASDVDEGEQTDPARLSRNEFRADLQRAMDSQEMLIALESTGTVRAVTVSDLRGMKFAALFVAGLVEGEFPERSRGDWIYPQHERDNLKEVGLALEDISPEESLRAEEHYFYQVACRATQILYLCRPLLTDDDSETVPSYFLSEIERVLPKEAIERWNATTGFDGETILSATTASELAQGIVRARSLETLDADRLAAHPAVVDALEDLAKEDLAGQTPILSASVLRRIRIEFQREHRAFDEYDGLIGDERLKHRIGAAFGDHTFSASEFNDFGQCGFRFFLKRVLNLTARTEAALDLQAIDEGIILHNALRRFFETFRLEDLSKLDPARVVHQLQMAAHEVFESFEKGMPPLNPKLWKIERHMLEILLERFLEDEIELQRGLTDVGMKPKYFELAFGMPNKDADPASTPEPLVLTRPPDSGGDADTLRIRGQIDRVDVAEDGTLVAYDYKKRSGPRVRDMRDGRDVQLGVYLEAIERIFSQPEERIAGGGYYSIQRAPRRNNGLYVREHSAYTLLGRADANMPHQAWTELRQTILNNIWDSFDRIRTGDFRLIPSENEKTCSMCEYSRVCRFDRHRIRLKKLRDRARPFPNDQENG